ncbi:porin [Yoonia algicola]|uniref:Porin n=1 Tax=Yoonia algicola TaxID=3137368 RepID=A0AAN0NGF3_9RHOB
MIKTSLTIAALGVFAAPAFAQELTFGSAGLNYSDISDSSDDFSTTVFNGEVEFSYDQFLFGANLDAQSFDAFGDDATVTNLGAFVGYAPVPELLLGASITNLSLDAGSTDDTLTGYEILAQYRTPTFGGAIVYSVPDSDEEDFDVTTYYAEVEVVPGMTLGAVVDDFSGVDDNIYNVSADYAQGPIAVRGYYTGITGEDLAIYGVRGSYDFGNGFSATGSIGGFEEFLADEATIMTIGAGYAFYDGLSIDASVGRLSIDSDDLDILQIGLTYEFGAPTRLDTKMTDAIREDRQYGLNALIPDVGIGGTGFGLL